MDFRNRILKNRLRWLETENKELKEREHLVAERLSVLNAAIEEYNRLGADTKKVKDDYTKLCHQLLLSWNEIRLPR